VTPRAHDAIADASASAADVAPPPATAAAAAPRRRVRQPRGAAAADALLLDAGQAATLLGYGRSTFYRMDEEGLVPRSVRIGSSRRWSRDELRRWVDAGCPTRERWEATRR